MSAALTAVCALVIAAPSSVDTRFAQVAPAAREVAAFARTLGQGRAVILIHGLRMHPISKVGIVRAAFSDWQKEKSALVEQLARDSDVFAFAYAQTAAADEVADAPDLSDSVRRVRLLGYRELVLVGYSAGGVIARNFVEDNPDSGVTKVVQVCAPNGGSGWASLPQLAASKPSSCARSPSRRGCTPSAPAPACSCRRRSSSSAWWAPAPASATGLSPSAASGRRNCSVRACPPCASAKRTGTCCIGKKGVELITRLTLLREPPATAGTRHASPRRGAKSSAAREPANRGSCPSDTARARRHP